MNTETLKALIYAWGAAVAVIVIVVGDPASWIPCLLGIGIVAYVSTRGIDSGT